MVTKTGIALRLALGILCGLTLVLLPTVFSAPTSNLRDSSTTGGTLALDPRFISGPAVEPSGVSTGINAFSFLTIIMFIFLPATIFSLVVRRWAEKRARDYLGGT